MVKMVNINIILPDDLHTKLKIKAAVDGRPLKELVNEALASAQIQ